MKFRFVTPLLLLLAIGCERSKEERTSLELAELKTSSYSGHETLPFWNAQRDSLVKQGVQQEGIDELARAYDEVLRKHSGIDNRVSDIAAVYEDVYTKEEITALVEFSETSVGQSILRKEALALQKITAIGDEEFSRIDAKKMMEEMKTAAEAVIEKYVFPPGK